MNGEPWPAHRCMKCGNALHYLGGRTQKERMILFCPLHPSHIVLISAFDHSARVSIDLDAAYEMVLQANGVDDY